MKIRMKGVKAVSEKVYTIEEIKNMLEEILKDKPVYKVTLFGSYAKQKATKKSDIDFLIKSVISFFVILVIIASSKTSKNLV